MGGNFHLYGHHLFDTKYQMYWLFVWWYQILHDDSNKLLEKMNQLAKNVSTAKDLVLQHITLKYDFGWPVSWAVEPNQWY